MQSCKGVNIGVIMIVSLFRLYSLVMKEDHTNSFILYSIDKSALVWYLCNLGPCMVSDNVRHIVQITANLPDDVLTCFSLIVLRA